MVLASNPQGTTTFWMKQDGHQAKALLELHFSKQLRKNLQQQNYHRQRNGRHEKGLD